MLTDSIQTVTLNLIDIRRMEMNYEHCRCECGGIIGQYSKAKGFTCERCNKEYQLSELNFDWVASNEKTGWLFPMLNKEDTKC